MAAPHGDAATDRRTTHVPNTIAGRPAAHVGTTKDGGLVYAPQREPELGGGFSPYPHITVRADSMHMSDIQMRPTGTATLTTTPMVRGYTEIKPMDTNLASGREEKVRNETVTLSEMPGWGTLKQGPETVLLSPRTMANATHRTAFSMSPQQAKPAAEGSATEK